MGLNFLAKFGIERLVKILLRLVTAIIRMIGDVPPESKKEVIDLLLDKVEANNADNDVVMTACQVLRGILDCPDDDIDQENPI